MIKKVLVSTMFFTGIMIGPASAYTVKEGDTLSEIAEKHGKSLKDISKMNPEINDLDFIQVGQNVNLNGSEPSEKKKTVKKEFKSSEKSSLSSYEKDLLARLVMAEAKGESYKGKVAVAEVVLNRVKSPSFPDTVQGVIYQRGQFSPVSDGSINRSEPSEEVRNAIHEAMSGSNVTNNALYFYNPAIATNGQWLATLETSANIGNHVFKK